LHGLELALAHKPNDPRISGELVKKKSTWWRVRYIELPLFEALAEYVNRLFAHSEF
jgi:hypothetical protein